MYLPPDLISSSCDGRIDPTPSPRCNHYLEKHYQHLKYSLIRFRIHFKRFLYINNMVFIASKITYIKLSNHSSHGQVIILIIVTVCIKVLPNLQKTNSIQVLKSAVHCNTQECKRYLLNRVYDSSVDSLLSLYPCRVYSALVQYDVWLLFLMWTDQFSKPHLLIWTNLTSP